MRGAVKDNLQSTEKGSVRLLDARAWHGPWCLLKIRGFQSRLAPKSLVKILIDDPQTTRDLALFLEKQGHHILKRTDGEMLVRTSSKTNPAFTWPEQTEESPINT